MPCKKFPLDSYKSVSVTFLTFKIVGEYSPSPIRDIEMNINILSGSGAFYTPISQTGYYHY